MCSSDLDFTFHGEYYNVEHGTVPTKSVRAPHPTVMAASRMDEGMDVVARECDTWFANHDKNFRNYDQTLRRIETEVAAMERRVAQYGRTMKYGLNACMIIGETDQEAIDVADDYLAQLARDPSIFSASGGLGSNVIGTPKTIAERIRRYQDLGIDLFMLQFYPFRQGLEVFAEKVLPLLDVKRTARPSAPPAQAAE